jgi:hypothetical protein
MTALTLEQFAFEIGGRPHAVALEWCPPDFVLNGTPMYRPLTVEICKKAMGAMIDEAWGRASVETAEALARHRQLLEGRDMEGVNHE